MQQAIQNEEQEYNPIISEHLVGEIQGTQPGPTVIAVAGIHGNEPTGVRAVVEVLELLKPIKEHIHGRFIGLKGNIPALEKNVRFIDEDMNRLWITSVLDKIRRTPFDEFQSRERKQIKELLRILDPLVYTDEEVIYIDLHTFSATGSMFSIIPHEERHVELLSQLKIPLVFGIQHTLIGTSMDYAEDAGHIGFAFETGSHGTEEAELNAVAGMMMLLVSCGLIPARHVHHFADYHTYLMNKVEGFPHKVEFVYKHVIEEGDEFIMNPNFRNFDNVEKGDWLATDRHGKIEAQADGYILMPLYQVQGTDGFFIVRDCE
ncbi:MAG: succinylglutamate desuccinylase/aspartoacylase family protein [Balneolales bacterium]|nr:succinylglutamate desuccinylase/aspartoacylase family protein [Balneolales bacterium]